MFNKERIDYLETTLNEIDKRLYSDELDIGTLFSNVGIIKAGNEDTANSLSLAYKKINELNETIMSLLERVEILEERSTSDKAIADGINQLMSYNPYDHVKGDY